MNSLLKSLWIFSLFFTTFLSAQTIHQTSFTVKGNCGMCKARIEGAAKEAGATAANWNADTQKVSLQFDPATTSADAILKKIADAGHDNELHRASDAVYEKLPGCCLYDREPAAPVEADNQYFVRGNCDMCQARIEGAAKAAGASAASWNPETQAVTLEFDPAKTTADAILKK